MRFEFTKDVVMGAVEEASQCARVIEKAKARGVPIGHIVEWWRDNLTAAIDRLRTAAKLLEQALEALPAPERCAWPGCGLHADPVGAPFQIRHFYGDPTEHPACAQHAGQVRKSPSPERS